MSNMKMIRGSSYRIPKQFEFMADDANTGAATVERLAGRDLNQDGKVINLVICGNSRFYNYEWIEDQLEQWTQEYDYPDLIIIKNKPDKIHGLISHEWRTNYRS